MKVITPALLSVFSRCPRAAYLGLKLSPEIFTQPSLTNQHNIIISEIVKNCYSYKTKTGEPPCWNWIKSWLDTSFRKYQDKLSYKEYTQAIEILSTIHQWFTQIYKPLDYPGGYINFPIEQVVSTGYKIFIPIDILSLSETEKITLIGFSEEPQSTRNSFANPFVYSRIWAAKKVLLADKLSYGIITMKPKSISYKELDLHKEFIDLAVQATEDIIKRITSGINYPLPAEHCSLCMYNSIQCTKIS